MKTTIKKVKDGRWFVELEEQDVTAVFDNHDEAVQKAYDMGADDFEIRYSSRVMRTFTREGVENLILNV